MWEFVLPGVLLEATGPEILLAFLAMALFSSRKTKSKSSGKPGQSRPDFLQFPHTGRFSSHWINLVVEQNRGGESTLILVNAAWCREVATG